MRSARFVPRLVALLALAALGVSTYLLHIALTEGAVPAGCAGDTTLDCDEVLQSRWSTWLGIPVSLPAAMIYSGLVVASLLANSRRWPRIRHLAWLALASLATLAAGAAIWFVALQALVLKAVCPYCLAVHACGALIAGLVCVGGALRDPHAPRAEPAPLQGSTSKIIPILAGTAGLAVLIIGQCLVKPTTIVVQQAKIHVVRKVEGPEPEEEGREARGEGPEPVGEGREARGESPEPVGEGREARGESPEPVEEGRGSRVEGPEPDAERRGSRVEGPEPDAERRGSGGANDSSGSPTAPARATVLSILDGKAELDLSEFPLLGSPVAKHVVVKLFDYTCHHCREMHQHLDVARQQYGDQLAIVLIPVPLNAGCNSAVTTTYEQHIYACHYARLALAVWHHNPSAFPEFHAWIFGTNEPPDPGAARRRANELLPGEQLTAAMDDPWVNQFLEKCVAIYEHCGGRQLPKLLIGGALVTGEANSADELYKLMETHLKMTNDE